MGLTNTGTVEIGHGFEFQYLHFHKDIKIIMMDLNITYGVTQRNTFHVN